MFMFFFGVLIGVFVGVTFILMSDKIMDKYLPPETLRACPPCDGNCNQGRDCPAEKK